MARLFPNTGTFRSLANYNYRLWAGGALVSNVGTWMQRVAQDWLVLTQLSDEQAAGKVTCNDPLDPWEGPWDVTAPDLTVERVSGWFQLRA